MNYQDYDFGVVTIGSKKKTATDEIENFLRKKNYLTAPLANPSLPAMLQNCHNDYRRAVLLIDDCHNATKDFFEELQSLIGVAAPVTIILCGRTDYSAGDSHFFSFAQWCIENECVRGWQLQGFTPKETERFVCALIHGVPGIVLEKICSMSQNNPLYIVQFIEYMLETNLAVIVNRSTVGITNVSTFSVKRYLPDGVHEIYQKRLDYLLSLEDSADMCDFLSILSFFDGKLPTSLVFRFFDERMPLFTLLLKHRFIRYGDHHSVMFIHESMYLFFRKRLEKQKKLQRILAALLFSNADYFLSEANQVEKGKLAYWNKNFPMAIDCFAETVNTLRSIPNCSSFDIDIEIYGYLDIIFLLYSRKKAQKELLKKVILAKIYIALHYFTPVQAIQDCDNALALLQTTAILSEDQEIQHTILEQKAHSFINAGQLRDAELVLHNIQAGWLLNPREYDDKTVFDMFDRLSGIYIKYNSQHIAGHYNQLSYQVASRLEDKNLLAISHLTSSKVYFYNNFARAKNSLHELIELLRDGSSERIRCSALLSLHMLEALHNPQCDWARTTEEAARLLRMAVNNSYASSIIRAYMLLAVCYFKTYAPSEEYGLSLEIISKGIDFSIRFGIPTYIWQFYNLQGIIQIRQNLSPDEILRNFETVYALLTRQNLLFLGNYDLCYGNVLALSNYGFFLRDFSFENRFYEKMSQITYLGNTSPCDFNCAKPSCGFICSNSTEELKQKYAKAEKREVLFSNQPSSVFLRDDRTKFFIVLS
jgi:hypothetical protein